MKKQPSLIKKDQAGFLFVLPVVLGILLVFLPMIAQTVHFSLNKITINPQGFDSEFIGLRQYVMLATQHLWFVQTSIQTFKNILIDLVCITIFSFFVAVLLNQKFKGRTISRMIFFLPVILAGGIIAQLENNDILMNMLHQNTAVDTGEITGAGLQNLYDILISTSLDIGLINIITDIVGRLYSVTLSSGVQILIFLSGLQSIPPSLREAACVEGSSGWEYFWKITFPLISPMIFVNAVYTMIDSSTKATNPIMSTVLHQIVSAEYTVASAMAILYMLVTGVIMLIIFGFAKKLVFYQN